MKANNSKSTEIAEMLSKKEISQEIHDEALDLTRKYCPWIWKRNKNKIVGVVNIFKDMGDERALKDAKKKKK